MYENYFGLDKAPFKITPDPEFFFSGSNRGAVLEALLYAVARGEGIVKVVGEVGSGKTMLCRMLERELPGECEIIYLANPRLSPNEILHAIAIELKLQVANTASKIEVMRLLHGYLLEKHAHNRSVVMFIEEAQGMALETLEEIRMLSNLETTQEKLLQIVLFGQPELDDKLRLHEIRQLKERITYSFNLAPLNRTEIRDYLNTRIRTSGFRGTELFSTGAIRSLEKLSSGLLRRINVLADKSLLAAYARGDRQIKTLHVKMAAKDSEFGSSFRFRPAFLFAGLLITALVLGSGLWWFNGRDLSPVDYLAGEARSTLDPAVPGRAESEIARPTQIEQISPELLEIDNENALIVDDAATVLIAEGPRDSPGETLGRSSDKPAHLLSLADLEPNTSPVLTTENLIKMLAAGVRTFAQGNP
jgi:type II secretory pathway predicted ATPase ExeA